MNGRRNWIVTMIATVGISVSPLFVATAIAQQVASGNAPIADKQTADAVLNRKISVKLTNVSLDHALQTIAANAGVSVLYRNEIIAPYRKTITLQATNESLRAIFQRILSGTSLQIVVHTKTRLLVVDGTGTTNATTNLGRQDTSGAISGVVIDSATQKRIRGATVVVNGTKRAASTDENGAFRIPNLRAGNYVLSVRLLGYASQTVSIVIANGEITSVRVMLRQSSTTLSEVVTTANESQRRGEISNEVVRIDADKVMEQAPIRTVADLIVAAQVPGVTVTKSSGELSAPKRIRIGGVGSISQNNDPVVIVDNVWIHSPFSTSEIASVGSPNRPSPLDAIDPSTIETIEIAHEGLSLVR